MKKIGVCYAGDCDFERRVIRKPFMLIDKESELPPSFGMYDILLVKTIVDKRGKEVPVVRLRPHVCDQFMTIGEEIMCVDCKKTYKITQVDYHYLDDEMHVVIYRAQNGVEVRENAPHLYKYSAVNDEIHKGKCNCGHEKEEPHCLEELVVGKDHTMYCWKCRYVRFNDLKEFKKDLLSGTPIKLSSSISPKGVDYDLVRVIDTENGITVVFEGENNSSLLGEQTEYYHYKRERKYNNFKEFWKDVFPFLKSP